MNSRINWNLLTNAMLSGFLTGAAARIFVISLPTLANKLETNITGISWALIAYPLATVSLSLIFGRVGDLYGRQTVFLVGFAVFTAASLLSGFSPSFIGLLYLAPPLCIVAFSPIGGNLSNKAIRGAAILRFPAENARENNRLRSLDRLEVELYE